MGVHTECQFQAGVDTPLLLRFPASGAGKTAEGGSSTGLPSACVLTHGSSSSWLHPGLHSAVGADQLIAPSLSLSVSHPHFQCNSVFQINTSLKTLPASGDFAYTPVTPVSFSHSSPEQSRLAECEEQAKAAKKGMWSEGSGAHTIRDLKYTIENPRHFVDAHHQKPVNGETRS